MTNQPTYYFIVYKIDWGVAGGSKAGVRIDDSTWLEFEEASVEGVEDF